MTAELAIMAIAMISVSPRVDYLASSPELINGLPLSNPQGLACDQQGEFLVADALNDRIVIFDSLANPVFDFALTNGQHNPFSLAANSSDEIIISAMDTPQLWIYDSGGQYLETIILPDGVLPGRIAVDSSNSIFVVDRAGRGILCLDRKGGIVAKYESDHSPCKPSGVSLDKNGDLLMVSVEGIALTGFNPQGKIKFVFGEHGRKLEDFSHPTSALTDKDDRIWIIDSFRHHIKRFNANGEFIDIIGLRGTGNGEFFFPVDLKISPNGYLGVLEKGNNRLQVFKVTYDK